MSENTNINYRDLVKAELKKCATDPVHFLRKYVYIQADKGRVLFDPFLYQQKLSNLFNKYDRTVIVKSRQLGITTLCAGYALWYLLFKDDRTILCLAPTQEKARQIVDKVRFAYNNLPTWFFNVLKIDAIEENKLSIYLKNGSRIKAASGASDSARSISAHLLIIDEAAFIENAEELWASAQQTLAFTKGKAIVLSTPLGMGNWFHKTYVDSENGENEFVPIKLPWSVHTQRDQIWRDQQDKELGIKLARQECDASFESSGDTFIEPEIINYFSEKVTEPQERRGSDRGYWIWEYPDPSKEYIVVADVARGDGNDHSSFHVIDIESNAQEAEYKGQMDTKTFSKFLLTVAIDYNHAMLIVEREGIGWSVVSDLIETQYRNLYYSDSANGVVDSETYLNKGYDFNTESARAGFSTNLRTRPLVLSCLGSYLREKSPIIRSKRFMDELRTFVWLNGKAQAQKGYNDDLIIPYSIGLYLRDTALRFKKQGVDLSRSALNNIRSTGQTGGAYNPKPKNPTEAWQMNVNGKNEDLRWLI